MGFDFFLPEDIHNALLAANEGSAQTAAMVAPLLPSTVELRAFRVGYQAALVTVGLAFGLPPESMRIGEVGQIEE